MALNATDACFNELTIGHKLTAIWNTLVELLQIYDPMANPSPLEAAQNACFNVLTSGQQFTAMWTVLDAILTASGGGSGAVNYFGNGDPNGVITASPGAIYVQLDGPGIIWTKISGVGNTGWAINT